MNSGSQQFELYNQHFYLFGAYVHTVNEHIRLKPSFADPWCERAVVCRCCVQYQLQSEAYCWCIRMNLNAYRA